MLVNTNEFHENECKENPFGDKGWGVVRGGKIDLRIFLSIKFKKRPYLTQVAMKHDVRFFFVNNKSL